MLTWKSSRFVSMGVPIEVVDLWIRKEVKVVDGFPEHVIAIEPYPGRDGFVVHCDDYEKLHPLVAEAADRVVVVGAKGGEDEVELSVVKKDRWKSIDDGPLPAARWYTTSHEAVVRGWTLSARFVDGEWEWNVLGPAPNGYSCSGRSDTLEEAKRDAEQTMSDLMNLKEKK
jgi:hypothetical protein